MQLGQFLPGFRESPKVLRQRNARQFTLQVLGVFGAVLGMMQNPVNVIEDAPLVDFLVLAMLAEMFQRPVIDVVVGIRRTRATSGSSRQIERQIAYVPQPAALDKGVEHLLLILVSYLLNRLLEFVQSTMVNAIQIARPQGN